MADEALSDAHRIVLDELAKLGGRQRRTDTDIYIPCPFHDEVKPSCGIRVTPGGPPIGYHFCFGCGSKGPWNKIADRLGLARIDAADEEMKSTGTGRAERRAEDLRVVGTGDGPTTPPEGVPYPYPKWRGIKGSVVRAAGGVLAEDRRGGAELRLPVERLRGHESEVVGVIRAALRREKGRASYILSEGSQVKDHGLMPLGLVRRRLAKGRSSVLALVEGPRDALRLIQCGLPALSIISATQWSAAKAADVVEICMAHDARPLSMMDGDAAGAKAQRRIAADLKEALAGSRIKPASLDLSRHGEGLDPANMPRALLDRITHKARR